MSRYGISYYGIAHYGESSIDFSCAITARPYPASHTTASGLFYRPSDNSPLGGFDDPYYMVIRWSRPSGAWDRLRLVRGKYGTPETEDDGIILLDSDTDPGSLVDYYSDDSLSGLRPGEVGYYGLWVRETATGRWFLSGYTSAINNNDYGSLSVALYGLPRIFVSSDMQILGPVDTDSQMVRWIQGYAFENDYWRTQSESLVAPLRSRPLAGVYALGLSIGMAENDLSNIGEKNLRRLLRSSSRLAEVKGTLTGLIGLASAATGWPAAATISPNKMLDTDDSSAERSVGRWTVSNGALTRGVVGTQENYYGSPVTLTSPYGTAISTATTWASSPPLQNGIFVLKTSSTTATMSLGNINANRYGIPVSPSTSYSFNLCWRVVTGSPNNTGSLTIDLKWYDINGVVVGSTVSSTPQSVSASWQQSTTATGTSHANAAYAGITLNFTSTTSAAVYHLDMMQFATSVSAGVFNDARAVDLVMAPARINYCLNPSFEVNASGWSAGSRGVIGGGYVSQYALRLNNTQVGTGTYTDTRTGTFAQGDPVTCSAHVKPVAGDASTSGTLRLKVEFLTSGGAVIGSAITKNAAVICNEYQRVSVTGMSAPATTSKVRFTVGGSGTSANLTGTGSTLDIDGVLIEQAVNELTYFDPSQDTTGYGGVFWANASHSSESLFYPGWLTKWPLLKALLPQYAPQPVYIRQRTWTQSDIA